MGNDTRSRILTSVFTTAVVLWSLAGTAAGETVLGFVDDRAFANLGISVDANGDWIVAGAPGYDVSAVEGGAVVVFSRSSGAWVVERIAEPPLSEAWSRFGFSVAVAGSTLVAGAPGWGDAGAAFIFDLSGLSAEVITLIPDDGAAGDQFGASVALDGDTMAVGAPQAGKVYIYSDLGVGQWQLAETLVSNQAGERFGVSVAVAGTRLAVGVDERETAGVVSGAVALYENSGQGWTESQILQADVQVDGALFGRAVDIEGDVVVVGAPLHANAESTTGACFVFRFDALSTQWNQEQVIGTPEATVNSLFGLDVDIRQGRIAVGAPGDGTSNQRGGATWLYTYDEPLWVLESRFEATSVSAGDHLGRSVASLDGLAVAGVPSDDVKGSASGSILVFTPAEWHQKARPSGGVPSRNPLWDQDLGVGDLTTSSATTLTCSFDAWPPAGLVPEYFNISVKELNSRFPGLDDLAVVLSQSGATGVGTKVHWEFLEPDQGLVEWASIDALLASFSSVRLDPLVTVRGVPRWASANPESEHYWLYPPSSMADWQAFLESLVTRYGSGGTGQVNRWEIWNEPNLDEFFLGSVDDYIEILNAATSAIKGTDAEAEVWAPTLTFHPWAGAEVWTFLDRVLLDGLFDVLSVHLYLSTPDEFHFTLVEIRRRLDAAGHTEVPIAVTEINVIESVTNCREFSEADPSIHANELDQILRCVAAAGAKNAFWFKSTDRGQYCSPPWDDTRLRNGLVGDDWLAKAEYRAYQDLAASLGLIFSDGFESGDTGAWTEAAPTP